jgi:hypothetical protein
MGSVKSKKRGGPLVPGGRAGDERILVVGKARFDVDDVGDGAATISKAVGKKNGDGLSRP